MKINEWNAPVLSRNKTYRRDHRRISIQSRFNACMECDHFNCDMDLQPTDPPCDKLKHESGKPFNICDWRKLLNSGEKHPDAECLWHAIKPKRGCSGCRREISNKGGGVINVRS